MRPDEVPEISIGVESPRDPAVARLIEDLDAYQTSLYPPESNHLLDVDALCAPDVRFFVVRRLGNVIGCGALRVDPSAEYGEIKRMFVSPQARGQQIGRRLLSAIEERARLEGLGWLRLETGIHQHDALALYRKNGYLNCPAFAPYRPDPWSVFMEKAL
jgi:putative acetyltransferase